VLPVLPNAHTRWVPFDSSRNWPDLGERFIAGERIARAEKRSSNNANDEDDKVEHDKRDLDWSAVLKRTFESYIRGERPNMYGEQIHW
jgi:WD repeat and SOF domain-containing protein 1